MTNPWTIDLFIPPNKGNYEYHGVRDGSIKKEDKKEEVKKPKVNKKTKEDKVDI